MPIPILKTWKNYFDNPDEGLGSTYERVVLNRKLEKICKIFNIDSVLEVPCFGFTGVSGINSVQLAKLGHPVTVVDHDQERLQMIEKVWNLLGLNLVTKLVSKYREIEFEDNYADLSWNFSALWMISDLRKFLQEISRLTGKVIFLGIPNTNGLGYFILKKIHKEEFEKNFREENLNIDKICNILEEEGWHLFEKDYIDVPWWPDIGMPKEKFLKIFGSNKTAEQKGSKEPLTLMDYYSGKDNSLPEKMMKHYWFEKNLPDFIKYFWAHHRFLVFIKNEQK